MSVAAEASQHVPERHEAAATEACSFCGREGLQAAKGRPTAEVDHHPDSGGSLDEIKDDGMRAFFDERSGEEI